MADRELVAASARPVILAILASGESYGYDILRRVREASGGAVVWSEGMLYPVLHRLEREGLLVARWGESDEGRRRKYYRLAPQGRKALASERERWRAVNATLDRLWGTT